MSLPVSHMLAAKKSVRVAAFLACRVQAGVARVVKADLSPVTVADFAAQAAVALILVRELHGATAVAKLLRGGGAPSAFRLLGEEDVAALAGRDAASVALLGHVVAAMSAGLPPRGAFLGHAGVEGSGDGEWSGADVLAAISACSCKGGLESECHESEEKDTTEAGAGEKAKANANEITQAHFPTGYWVLDPIDGTKGFLRGGQWAVGLAYVARGVPVLAAIAAPNVPLGVWSESGSGSGSGGAGGAGGVGVLFSAALGEGGWVEDLHVADGATARPTPLTGGRRASHADLVLCESFEAAHTDRSMSVAVVTALGSGSVPPIQIDSMVKYGLLARGCGDIYVRLPQRGYKEKVWDHAPGALLIKEAGGVITDARGKVLDFSRGSTLDANEGIIAAMDPVVHRIALEAAIKALAARQG